MSEPKRKPTRQQRWRDRNPLATWAHSATRSAIRRGLIQRPDRCGRCGNAAKLDAHHPDHRDPLRTEFLCRPCHKAIHKRPKTESAP
jgi:hypothetical protein